ncbi:bifunctional 3,4-dihydroxy-2-butanone-4-phosphate synthase/GTP cyclohydrolase II [Denitratisoma oestradiolicum]|uniref:3,4-dihydroxy-2-butanone 4-phosphate synthase n=1 Tax=Denitratisoma oestradiolicum TaxID=311182 RepID=A0A6S6Y0X0_9PROT|nr:bifunctional 3,4-dihydroxy-2-butanone-4-phosphate synthase/GTP cyclohydrolase II [Denitratisoma oestradiolicum]TWO80741.1 3,4-dihydroxy-2-butanone-4-phosphate synthase [Denitratisoma oestradiolicum]CAB1370953.1 3,4-dihydroxy-2-butanone 4-phosphate synthase [Denitratisoma oestradiolicum]
MSISSTEEIIADIRAGKMVILVDEEDRENEGDLVMAAEHVTPEAVNFMAKFGRGLICLTLTQARCEQLDLPLMVSDNRTPHGTAFTMSIEAAEGVTTGISAYDRALTVQAAVKRNAKPADLVQPGHIFPLMARNGGVLVRAGHTEAGCDFAALAGLEPAAVICEILKDDGTMARLPDLLEFAPQHGLKIGTIRDLIHYRSENEKLVERVAENVIHTRHGTFRALAYVEKTSGETHLALTYGDINAEEETLVRVHAPGSVLDWLESTPRFQSYSIDQAMEVIVRRGKGVIVLLSRKDVQEKLVPALQRDAGDPPPKFKWDPRTNGIGAQILRDLGARNIRLMARPQRIPSMEGFDLHVVGHLLPEDAFPKD